jgi:hypothetical protein
MYHFCVTIYVYIGHTHSMTENLILLIFHKNLLLTFSYFKNHHSASHDWSFFFWGGGSMWYHLLLEMTPPLFFVSVTIRTVPAIRIVKCVLICSVCKLTFIFWELVILNPLELQDWWPYLNSSVTVLVLTNPMLDQLYHAYMLLQ